MAEFMTAVLAKLGMALIEAIVVRLAWQLAAAYRQSRRAAAVPAAA